MDTPDPIVICNEIVATLEAAEFQLRVHAAQILPFGAFARVARNADRRSQALLAAYGAAELPEAGARDEDTEELLHAAVTSRMEPVPTATRPRQAAQTAVPLVDLDDGPEGAADVAVPLTTDEDAEAATESAPSPGDAASFVSFEEEPNVVRFDDDEPPVEERADEVPMQAHGADDHLVRFEDDTNPLVKFDEDTQPVPPGFADEEPAEGAFEDEEETRVAPRRRSEPEGVEEFDLMPDAASEETLVQRTQDDALPLEGEIDDIDVEAFEEEEATPPPTPDPLPQRRPGSLDSAGSVVVGGRGRPQPREEEDEKSPTPVPVSRSSTPPAGVARGKKEEKPVKKEKGTPTPAARAAVPTAAARARAAVPTVRDAGEQPSRPRSAAIQLTPQGTAKALGHEEEEEPIEMGEAEDVVADESEGGFTLSVEEYEEIEEEEEQEEPEVEEELPKAPEPDRPAGPDAGLVKELLERAYDAVTSGENEAAIALFSDVLDADQDNVEARIQRGRVYLDLSDYARAMSDFTQADELAADNPEVQVAIGDLYFARKDYRKAIDCYNSALAISPNYGMAFCRRGISHYYRKNYAEAVDDLLKAQRLDPEIQNIDTFVAMAKKRAPGRR